MFSENKVAVIGGGSWATALVKIFSNNCKNVTWWLRSEEAVNYIKQQSANAGKASVSPS